jgi:hypothetical protein
VVVVRDTVDVELVVVRVVELVEENVTDEDVLDVTLTEVEVDEKVVVDHVVLVVVLVLLVDEVVVLLDEVDEVKLFDVVLDVSVPVNVDVFV